MMSSSSGPVFHHLKTNSEDDLVSELSSEQDHNYMVYVPPTPDNQLQRSSSRVVEDQYASSSLFTGGFNCATRAHFKEKVIDSETIHPQMTGVKGSSCSMPGCGARVLTDERGLDVHPCECGLKFCRDCYRNATRSGDGACPGCNESYKGLGEDYKRPSMSGIEMERKASLTLRNNMALVKSYSNVLEESKWLYETKGSYGYGDAMWSKEEDGFGGDPPAFRGEPWRPLTRKLNISAAILCPYRILILVRTVVLGLFLFWRIRNPNDDAVWLWFMSVICEIWFAFSWLLDQLPKLCPVNRVTDLDALREKFETPNPGNPTGISDLPGVDIFVSTSDPEKEAPLVTANTILSILAADYPVEKLSCYVSDDGGSLLTFEAMAEAASFADLWVPFCRKHDIEPRNPESYFNMKIDPYKNKVLPDFVRDRRRVKREYDEFKVRVNALSDSIRRRSDAFNAREEMKAMKILREKGIDEAFQTLKIPKATWMADQTHWPGSWEVPEHEHTRANHSSIIQVMLGPPSNEPLKGDGNIMNLSEVDIRLPMLVYVSREKRHDYDHSSKAGAMNALLRASAIMSNGPFVLDLDRDHYIHNSKAIREGMCFMMDRGGDSIAYVQFPHRFEGIDPSDRYTNKNTVFFDVNMRALDGIQGPVCAGTGCLFRRIALYGFDPPGLQDQPSCYSKFFLQRKKAVIFASDPEDGEEMDISIISNGLVKAFGNSSLLIDSIPKAVEQGKPLADHPSVKHGRLPGVLTAPRDPLDASIVAEAVDVVSCWYEDKTEWGGLVGWVYGSMAEEVVTGYRMHNRGWRSVYCAMQRDAFRGSAPINLTDRLRQVLRGATGSVEMFFSRNNALLASSRLKLLQRIAYLNIAVYPFASLFLVVYCFLPALSLFTGKFVVRALDAMFLSYLMAIALTFCFIAVLEIKWSGILLEEWWRNEQFWVIGGTSAHVAAVFRGLLKAVAGIEVSFTSKSKSGGGGGDDDEFADLYVFKWTAMMVLPITIMMVNVVGLAVGVSRTIYGTVTKRGELMGGVLFSVWVLVHLYPFAKGLMGKRGKAPTIVFVWSGLLAITISLLWVAIDHPAGNGQTGWSFGLP